MRSPQRSRAAFVYRAGIGLVDTHITCDAAGFASDLIFLSHAHALSSRGAAKLAGERAGRRQIVTTETTLRLIGGTGDKLRARTLPAAYGRPFNLGGQRIEVVPSGYLPGAAGLLCETAHQRLFYLGAFAPEGLVPGLAAAEVRHADAVCVDARFADPGMAFPPRKQVLADIRAFAQSALAEGRTPVVLTTAVGALPALARELGGAGLTVRAHARLASQLARLHEACADIPAVGRTGRAPRAGEVWLWPVDRGRPPRLPSSSQLRLAWVAGPLAGHAGEASNGLTGDRLAGQVAGGGPIDAAFTLTPLPSHGEIVSLLAACGAREVALLQSDSAALVADLRGRGFHAYGLGPPRQMTLVG